MYTGIEYGKKAEDPKYDIIKYIQTAHKRIQQMIAVFHARNLQGQIEFCIRFNFNRDHLFPIVQKDLRRNCSAANSV